MATYGEGDPTDNAQEFYEWLQAGDGDLAGMNFAVSIFKNFLENTFCYLFVSVSVCLFVCLFVRLLPFGLHACIQQ